jgi:hypothetical protein
MCFKPARDPRIEEEQRKAREEAEAAKEAALAKKEAERQKLLEQERYAAETGAQRSNRQSELRRTVSGQLTATGISRSVRGGRRGRGSLMTSGGSGVGYYSARL